MHHCPACGGENRPGASFCDQCGARFAPKCSSCGGELRPAARFCDACGQAQSAAAPNGPSAPSAPPRREASLPQLGGGRYRVSRLLGEGAKKRVYLAHDTRLDREVALALIKSEGLDEAGLSRVRREARAMGRLSDHANIVTVFDVGEDDGQTYIVGQYMSGGSVSDLLERTEKRRLPIDQAVALASQICGALEHAHARGIVHRDLKSANVWLADDGTAKLGDFGLALALDRSRLTIEGMMVGTVAYMPPEQALGRAAEARSDLYSLGAMLYEMLTGRPPFLGDDAVAVISQHINTPPVAPSWHNSEVPRALEALTLRLLAKAPEDRPESAAVVRQALDAIAAAPARPADAAAREEANPLDRLASGVFVGREREMDELRADLEGALSGRGQMVLLVGEAGIGKTRTAEELVTYARLRKAQVLWGRCYEGEGAPAYWPWVQAIRAYVHDRDPAALLSDMGSGATDIAQVVSEVRERLPGLAAPTPVDAEQARFRLFDSIATFLKNTSRRQPLVLVFDDLHWADRSSLLLLHFIGRELHNTRVMIVATYRDVDLRRQHPLAQALAEMTREQLSHRIVLRGLTQHDVARFIEVTAGIKPPESLVHAVFSETEGNPFFVNEVVRLLVSDGRLENPEKVRSWSVSIPQGVREVVGRRLDHLSAECNEVLTIAAVIGREFALEALEQVIGQSNDRLLELLDEAVASRVVAAVPRSKGRYTFSHALIRETLYEELTTTRRIRLHRQVGEALEMLYGANPEPHLAELAHHFFEAAQGGDVERAVAYAVRAGDRAAAMMAHEEAARQYEMALQALELRERSDPARCAMLLTLSETLWCAGEYDRAKETALQAAELARQSGTPVQLARAALGFGGRLVAFAAVIRDDSLVALLTEALSTLDPKELSLRAELLGRLAEEVTFSESYDRRQAMCDEAIALARQSGDSAVIGRALRSAHWSLWSAENVEARLALAEEILHLSSAGQDRALRVEAHFLRAWDLLELRDMDGVDREMELCTRETNELRQPYHRWALGMNQALLAFARGRLGEIEGFAAQALQVGQETQNPNAVLVFGIQILLLLREQGRFEEMVPYLGSMAMFPAILPHLRCAQALFDAEAGLVDQARSQLAELTESDLADMPVNLAWLFSIASLAQVAAIVGDAQRAARLYEILLPFAGRVVTIGPVVVVGSVAQVLGALAATMERWDAAAVHFERAMQENAETGTRQALARTHVDYAEMLLRRDHTSDSGRALDLLNRALSAAIDLGMKRLVERALTHKLKAQGMESTDPSVSVDAVASLVLEERPDLRKHASPDGTVTILFSDVEGSTPMFERLGDRRAQKLLNAHNRIVRTQIASHSGFEVKAQGDGFMVAFQSASRALQCAVALQNAFARYNERHAEEQIRIRIGLHTGETIKEGDDFFGRAVAQAARIAATAAGGEILVSSVLRELTANVGEFTFDEGRDLELKGLSGVHRVYRAIL